MAGQGRRIRCPEPPRKSDRRPRGSAVCCRGRRRHRGDTPSAPAARLPARRHAGDRRRAPLVLVEREREVLRLKGRHVDGGERALVDERANLIGARAELREHLGNRLGNRHRQGSGSSRSRKVAQRSAAWPLPPSWVRGGRRAHGGAAAAVSRRHRCGHRRRGRDLRFFRVGVEAEVETGVAIAGLEGDLRVHLGRERLLANRRLQVPAVSHQGDVLVLPRRWILDDEPCPRSTGQLQRSGASCSRRTGASGRRRSAGTCPRCGASCRAP